MPQPRQPEHSAEKDALLAAGYHVMRQGTWDNHTRELAVLRNENRWLREEKEHHEKWLAGILDESRRLQDRFNRITAALAVSGVEWSVIADLLGDDTRVNPPEKGNQDGVSDARQRELDRLRNERLANPRGN